jgi:3-isopropylmalate/(R)-2-methylmalate dehydratase small subunit
MEKIEIIKSKFTVLNIENIDTDQIIPAVHLKSIDRLNFGKFLFSNWRDSGKLSKTEWPESGAVHEILVSGENFGCGSSREHAVWALKDYGFKAIIASKIADIFTLNSLNNGLLPIELDEEIISQLMTSAKDVALEINLKTQRVNIPSIGISHPFEISAFKKECMLNGFDTIDYLINSKEAIETYENNKKMTEKTPVI